MGKLVPSDDHEKMVSYIVFTPPGPPDERTDEEKARGLRAQIDGNSQIRDKDLAFRLKMEDKVLNERFFGRGYESRFWEVCGLCCSISYFRSRSIKSRPISPSLTSLSIVDPILSVVDSTGNRPKLPASRPWK